MVIGFVAFETPSGLGFGTPLAFVPALWILSSIVVAFILFRGVTRM